MTASNFWICSAYHPNDTTQRTCGDRRIMAMNAWLPRIEAGSEPKYQVIARAFAQAILNGQLPAGEKLPPHRSLASELRVTTGTISRAYAELERQGLANARVGDGTYVAQARSRELPSATNGYAALRPGL